MVIVGIACTTHIHFHGDFIEINKAGIVQVKNKTRGRITSACRPLQDYLGAIRGLGLECDRTGSRYAGDVWNLKRFRIRSVINAKYSRSRSPGTVGSTATGAAS